MASRRRLLLVGTHVAAIAVGAVLGWYFATRVQQYTGMLRNVGSAGLYSLHLDLLRREGQAGDYEDALLSFLAFLEERQRGEPDPFLTKAVVQADTVLVLARLARLEAEAGRDAEAKAYEDRAVRTCLEIPWKTCDAQTILRLSERMEKGDSERKTGRERHDAS